MTVSNTGMSSLKDVIKKFKIEDDKYVSREFQQYGYDLATELGDLKRVSYYIKIARDYPRGFIESARGFVKDAYNVRSKAKLFTWKLTELRKGKKAKDDKQSLAK